MSPPPAARTSGLGSAIGWSTAMTGGRQVGNLLVTFVIAALLGPTAYGLVAMALVYIAFVEILMQQGLRAALVQREDLEDDHLNTAFWMLNAVSVGLLILSILGSGSWAALNDQPQLGPLVRALSPVVLCRGLIVVPEAILLRSLSFRPLALRTNLAVVVGGIGGITAALLDAGVWALVVQQLGTVATEVVVVWVAVSWRPRFAWSRIACSQLLSFSWRSGLASIGVFLRRRVDVLVIGLFIGPTAVGLYRFAARLVNTITDTVIGSIRAVALPEFARHQNDNELLRRRVLLLQRLSAAAAFGPLVVLGGAAPAVIAVLGEEWTPSTNALRLLCVAAAGIVVGQNTGPLLQAKGRPGLLAVITWSAGAASAVALVIGTSVVQSAPVSTQVTTLALLTLVLQGVGFLAVNLWVTAKVAKIPLRGLVSCLAPAMLAAGCALPVMIAVDALAVRLPPLARLALTAGIGAAVAIAMTLKAEPEVWRWVAEQRRRRRRHVT